jgi:glycosyltransferase involved in cell wall biosynthesis
MNFSIVICSYKSDVILLEKVLNSCRHNLSKVSGEIILVSNGAQILPMEEYIDSFSSKVDQFFHLESGSLEKARIEGVSKSNGEFIVFVDDDNILDENYLFEAQKIINLKINENPLIIGGINFLSREHHNSDKTIPIKLLSFIACDSGFIKSETENHNSNVPGAGMIISKNELLKLYSTIQLLCTGRSSGHLLSGDDTEMCFYFRFKNAQIIKSNKLLLKHEIPNQRLDKGYIVDLSSKMLITLPYLHFIYWRKSKSKSLSIILTFLSSFLVLFRWMIILKDFGFLIKGFHHLYKGNKFLIQRISLIEKNIFNYVNS